MAATDEVWMDGLDDWHQCPSCSSYWQTDTFHTQSYDGNWLYGCKVCHCVAEHRSHIIRLVADNLHMQSEISRLAAGLQSIVRPHVAADAVAYMAPLVPPGVLGAQRPSTARVACNCFWPGSTMHRLAGAAPPPLQHNGWPPPTPPRAPPRAPAASDTDSGPTINGVEGDDIEVEICNHLPDGQGPTIDGMEGDDSEDGDYNQNPVFQGTADESDDDDGEDI